MHGCFSCFQLSRASDNVGYAYPLKGLLSLHFQVDIRLAGDNQTQYEYNRILSGMIRYAHHRSAVEGTILPELGTEFVNG
jgi:hypothetical protein